MNNIIRPKICPSIIGHAAAVGKKEHEGPLGNLFDYHDASDRFGQKTWELSEGEMQHIALNLALSKSKMPADFEIRPFHSLSSLPFCKKVKLRTFVLALMQNVL